MFEIKISAPTVIELNEKLLELASSIEGALISAPATVAEIAAETKAANVKAGRVKAKATGKKNADAAKVEKQAQQNVADPIKFKEAHKGAASLDMCKTLLQQLSTKKGIATCVLVLGNFGVKKLIEIEEKDYAGFIAACEKEMAQ